KDDFFKKMFPRMAAHSMLERAMTIYNERPSTSCSGLSCGLNEYRACLMHEIPTSLSKKINPISFEDRAKKTCLELEGTIRGAIFNDLDDVLRRHMAGGFSHAVYDVIRKIFIEVQHDVVILYGEDLVQVQPARRSCRPEMCGASPCLSIDPEAP